MFYIGVMPVTWFAKILIFLISYVCVGATVTITDLLYYYDEYMDKLTDMLRDLNTDTRQQVEDSDLAAVELCMRMFINEVLIWPLIVLLRILDYIVKRRG